MNRRAIGLTVILVVAALLRLQLQAKEPGEGGDLERFPMRLADWTGQNGPPFEPDVLRILKADANINRVYSDSTTTAGLYVGYHRSQTYGSTVHSPLNCLPGAGWQPTSVEAIPFGGGHTVKRVIVQKGESRQLVVYWYQTATRVEGSEYRSKFHLVVDAFSSHRNDAALVRIMIPLEPGGDDESQATRAAMSLAALVQPQVQRLLFEAI
jgi:EpsI family protein